LLFRDVGDFDTPAEPFSDFSSGLKCQLSLGVLDAQPWHGSQPAAQPAAATAAAAFPPRPAAAGGRGR
jgi:hypothetical protein